MSRLGRIQFEISSFPVLHTVHRVSGIFTVEPILRKTGTGCPTPNRSTLAVPYGVALARKGKTVPGPAPTASCFGVERDNVIRWNSRAFRSAYVNDRHRLFLRQEAICRDPTRAHRDDQQRADDCLRGQGWHSRPSRTCADTKSNDKCNQNFHLYLSSKSYDYFKRPSPPSRLTCFLLAGFLHQARDTRLRRRTICLGSKPFLDRLPRPVQKNLATGRH